MNTRADTCCAIANSKLFSFYNDVCDVSPLLDLYQPVKEITMTRVSTVWIDPNMSREYLIVSDQFLWFGTMMDHSIINPNQVREFNIPVHDKNSDATIFGIGADEAFISLTSKGKVIRFESRVPMKWE